MGRPSRSADGPAIQVSVRLPPDLHAWLADAGPDVRTALIAALRAQQGATGYETITTSANTVAPPSSTNRSSARLKRAKAPAEPSEPCRHPVTRRIGTGCGACGRDPV